MAASWFFDLCDANGSRLDELTTAAGRQLSFKRNSYAEVQFSLSHEDEAAELLLNAVANTGMPTLKCWRKPYPGATAVLRFNGQLSPFSEDASDTALLTPVFRSPFARCMGDGSGAGRFTAGSVVFTGQDAGSGIAIPLLTTTNADGPTGLIPGSVEATKTRDRTYQHANVGQAITDLSAVLDGFDFVETFLDAGATLAQLDVMAHQGTLTSGVAFAYGAETLNNVQSVSRTTAPPVNSVTVLGASLTSVQTDAASIVKYGLYPVVISATDVAEQATLDDIAFGLLRSGPVKTISFTPDPALAPSPWDDYWLGDMASFYARRGALVEDVDVRVNGVTVVVDNNGREVAEIPDPTTPEDEATIRANLQVEVTAS